MRRFATIALRCCILLFASTIPAQIPATTPVPNLVRYGGVLRDAQGAAVSSATVGVTFAIYKLQDGGAAVWMETQNVSTDVSGNYNVLLGSTTTTGLPRDLFSQQEQRWLGVQVEGQPEQPRVLMVSVPYAFKAYDAETLGGLPASAFLKTGTIAGESAGEANSTSANARSAAGNADNNLLSHSPCAQPTFTGSPSVIAVWDSTGCNLTNSPSVNAAQGYQIGGSSVLSIGSSADNNVFLGVGAGTKNVAGSGKDNVFSGFQTGYNNTTASDNAFYGYKAGYHTTIGSDNAFYGYAAGFSNISGLNNTFSGFEAGYSNTAGQGNASSGTRAGYHTTTGNYNTFYGYQAGFNNTSGGSDIYVGNQGPTSGTESNTIRIGTQGTGAGQQNVAYIAGIYGSAPSGNPLTVVVNPGGQLGTTTTGPGVFSFNSRSGTVVPQGGDYSFSLLSGSLQDFQLSGTYSGAVTLSNTSNVYYGSGSNLTGVIPGAGSPFYIQNGTTQQANSNFTISGVGAANTFVATTNYQIGTFPVLSSNSSAFNLFVGAGAGNNGSGSYNTFSGWDAGYSNGGNSNTFTGYAAGYYNGYSQDTYTGFEAGYSNPTYAGGFSNTFTGYQAGYSNEGWYNTFTGVQAGFSVTGGYYNTFTGDNAGYSNTNGSANSFEGYGAGANNTVGSYDIFSGYNAGMNNSSGSSDIYIGSPGASSGGESNAIRIGTQGNGTGQQNVAYIAGIYGTSVGSSGVPVYVNSNGQLGTTLSSVRFKDQVRDMADTTVGLMKLRPVTFLYKPEYSNGDRTLQYGLIAEEVAKVYPELVAYDNDGKPYTVRYQYLAPMLLNEVQKQYRRAEDQEEVIKAQQEEIKDLKSQVQRQNALLQLQNAALQDRLSQLEKLVETQLQIVAQGTK